MNVTDIPLGRLYNDLAYLFPLVTPPEEYAEEAPYWLQLLRERLGPGRHAILELGVGGGHNLSHFAAEFDVTAVDRSPAMLEHSRRLNPSVRHVVGDMRSIRLGQTFAAVLIHDAISCLTTESDLRDAFRTVAAHLAPGGILILGPDYFRETFAGPTVDSCTHSAAGMTLTFIEYAYDPDPSDTWIEAIMFFLIREHGELRVEHDRQRFGLFSKKTWLESLTETGFSVDERPGPAATILLLATRDGTG